MSVLGADLKFVNGKTCREEAWSPVNAPPSSLLRNAAYLYSAAYPRNVAAYQKEAEQRPLDSGEEVGVFRIRLPLSGQAIPLSQG